MAMPPTHAAGSGSFVGLLEAPANVILKLGPGETVTCSSSHALAPLKLRVTLDPLERFDEQRNGEVTLKRPPTARKGAADDRRNGSKGGRSASWHHADQRLPPVSSSHQEVALTSGMSAQTIKMDVNVQWWLTGAATITITALHVFQNHSSLASTSTEPEGPCILQLAESMCMFESHPNSSSL